MNSKLSVSVVRSFLNSTRRMQASNKRTICNAARVDCKEAVSLMKDGHVYLDVRTVAEFSAGHIEGAPVTNVPVWQKNAEGGFEPNPDFVSSVEQAFPDKSGNIIVACASGKRSAAAVAALEQVGYTSLKDMSSGYNGWCAEGLPTTC